MEMKVTFIAIDGTDFEDREDCLQYESSLVTMCEFVKIYDRNFHPIPWNPEDYDSMWNHLYYIVIEPHHEDEAEEWWRNSFGTMLGISNPFDDFNEEWRAWKRHDHGDEPTIVAFDFCGNDDWIIFNNTYYEAKEVIKGLNLVDALC